MITWGSPELNAQVQIHHQEPPEHAREVTSAHGSAKEDGADIKTGLAWKAVLGRGLGPHSATHTGRRTQDK
jgi:hypothetical protein